MSGERRSICVPRHRFSPVPIKVLFWACQALVFLQQAKACMPSGASNSGVTQGKSTYVCLVFSHPTWGTGGSNFSRVAFTPSTDRFSRLTFSDSFDNTTSEDTLLKKYNGQVAVHVESMGVLSYQKIYRTSSFGGRVFPVMTAIISVDKGVVTGIMFDTGCVLCNNNDRCIANTYTFQGAAFSGAGSTSDCYLTAAECAIQPSLCQMTLYVVWTGTDSNGNYLTSSSRRFSLFSSFSVNSYFNGLGKSLRATRVNQYNQA